MGVRTTVVVGGVDNMTQAIALSKRPHVVVGTPGRILDHLENTKGFHLRGLKYLVRRPRSACRWLGDGTCSRGSCACVGDGRGGPAAASGL
jgi:hypothetical protein